MACPVGTGAVRGAIFARKAIPSLTKLSQKPISHIKPLKGRVQLNHNLYLHAIVTSKE